MSEIEASCSEVGQATAKTATSSGNELSRPNSSMVNIRKILVSTEQISSCILIHAS